MTRSYEPIFVVLSVIVAMLASFAALDLAGRVRSVSGAKRFGWIAGGATVMGLGIWSMHFVGMLAFHLPVPIGYDVPLMLLSVVVAIAASLLALLTISSAKLGLAQLIPGGVLMGGAIAGMHYIGMASMRADAHLSYSPSILVLSVLIAIGASIAALWLAFRFRSDETARGTILKILSAGVMGVAIAGMHYTGMAAARFAPGQSFQGSTHYILASGELGSAVVIGTILIIILALIGAVMDRSLEARHAFTVQLAEQTVQLTRSEQQYRLLFDDNPNPMWVYEVSNLTFLAVNEAALRRYGYSRDEFLTITLNEIRAEQDLTGGRIILTPSDANGAGSWQGRHRKKDGSLIDVEVSWQEIMFDGRAARLGLAIDVTDSRRAEESLRQNEQRTRLIIDTALDAVITMDASGRITEWNSQAEKIFGWSRDEAIGRPVADAIIPHVHRDAHRQGLKRFFATGDGPVLNQRIEITALRRDGLEFPIELAISPAKLGEDWTFNAFIRDLTEKRSLEAQLRHASKLEAVGQLAGGIAHDFNNLLTVIISYGSMLLDRIEPTDPNRGDVQEIATAADRAAELTRQLLAFSRKQVMQPQIIDVNVVIGEIETMLRRLIGEDIQLHTSLGKLVDNINVDPGQLEQVLVNLVVNARDAMPSGGLLSISTSNSSRSEDPDVLAECVDGQYVVLAVSDTGTGMTEDIQRRIFDPFFTTKEQGRGTGLGLSTAYGIVKQSGGEITVSSEAGKGSTFKVFFPCITRSEEPRTLVAKPPDPPRGTETILLVEDDSTVRTLAERILKKCGYEVLVACEGAEALAIASDQTTMIDAVVTDFVMPGINGRQLVEKLHELRPEIASLLMSGYNDDKTLHRGVHDGDTAFLQKPFSPDQLARKVRSVLDRVSP